MKYLKGIAIIITCWVNIASAETILDESRNRHIPVEITFPAAVKQCTADNKCPVVFLSAGYGISYLDYSFLSKQLNQLGFLVVSIAHELPGDPHLSTSGNLYETRSENWRRGAKTLDHLQNILSERFISYDFDNLLLVGHSNGGDISAWLGNEAKTYIKTIITLDHRRVPLPRNRIKVLSIRASDYPADKNVLPTETEQQSHSSCVVTIPKAKHNDIADFGPLWLKEKINSLINGYLKGEACSGLRKA